MKNDYVSPMIEFIWLDRRDVITTSETETDVPIIGGGPIGGDGYDADGWT